MAKAAEDKVDRKTLEEAIAKLSPEEAQYFLETLTLKLKKRKIQLTGYLVAMFVWLVTMIGAVFYYGAVDGFTVWVFLVPFASMGLTLYVFGKWGTKVGGPDELRDPKATGGK